LQKGIVSILWKRKALVGSLQRGFRMNDERENHDLLYFKNDLFFECDILEMHFKLLCFDLAKGFCSVFIEMKMSIINTWPFPFLDL